MIPLVLVLASLAMVTAVPGENNLVIVGGINSAGLMADVEIVKLNTDNPTCMKPPSLPVPTGGTFSTYTNNGEMIVCGGFADGYRDQCDIYNFEYVTWRPWENTLSSPRAYAASAFLNETHWWYTGGIDNFNYLSSTELYDIDNDETSSFVDIPVPTDVHAMVKLNESHFYICCGHDMKSRSYIFNSLTEAWTEMPTTEYDHDGGFAGLITRPSGKQEIVLSGSIYDEAGNITEIFDLEDLTWRPGPNFPEVSGIWFGKAVQYQDSFLAVGGAVKIGEVTFSYSRYIWYFDVDGDATEKQEEEGKWVRMDATLERVRQSFSALFIPDELC